MGTSSMIGTLIGEGEGGVQKKHGQFNQLILLDLTSIRGETMTSQAENNAFVSLPPHWAKSFTEITSCFSQSKTTFSREIKLRKCPT